MAHPLRLHLSFLVLLLLGARGQAFFVRAPAATATATSTSRPALAVPVPDVAAPSLTRRNKQHQQQLNRLDLRSPFISVEIKPATRLEELLAVVDLRAAVFAASSGLTVEAKLRHIKHLLTRRAKGSVVLVATARDLLSPFSEEVVIGSLECSTHEFEDGRSPFLHDSPHVRKLYVTEMCVKDAFRRQGVASSLLKAVDGVAAKAGAAYVCLFCDTTNRAASRLYNVLGYHSVDYSPSVEAFADALGLLKATKVYGFHYKTLAVASAARPAAAAADHAATATAAAAAAPSLTVSAAQTCLAGQQTSLWGKNSFSWW